VGQGDCRHSQAKAMKKTAPLLWIVLAVAIYVLSSVPAVRILNHTKGSGILIVYRPLSYLIFYPPFDSVLIWYWNSFIEPDENPLYFG
jgi:hypothetical protein